MKIEFKVYELTKNFGTSEFLNGNEFYSDSYTFDIPKQYLSLDIVEEIQRLNSLED